MPEINNALALGVKPMELDIAKPLLAAGQINYLRANTAKTQQDIDYNQTLQDQGEAGMRPQEQNTLAEAHTKQLGVAGQIGNMLFNDQSPASRQQAIKAAKDSGVKIDPQVEQHMLTAPAAQVKQYGLNMQRAGQSAAQNIEQNPGQVGQRSYMGAAGATAGPTGGPLPSIPPAPSTTLPAMQDRPATAPVRTNPDGSISGNLATEPAPTKVAAVAPQPVNPLRNKGITEAQNAEQIGNAAKNVEEYAGYKSEAINAANTKYLLRNLNDDADRFPTGKGANVAGAFKQWTQAAGQIPGVGPIIQKITGDYSDPVAAFEAVQKNAGQLTRATLKDADGRAASEYRMIQAQLPNAELSPKGLKLVTAQMTAPEDYKQARLQAADSWKNTHNDSIGGFAADWNSKISPSAFLMARLPEEERNGVITRLQKTPDGKNMLKNLKTQMQWAHDTGLDSVVD